ncbi:flagellar basal body P-ring formation chaperone FlgA [Methylopila sp. M107]|uniref:flagellar basal body P-ring formation chaperone FlgA n=1 Tax=Methylopila sp. M107 TaxID=1101190 RepID=UPI0003AA20E0|nr:flagellar basal body P-ring formation chaperone FlgA [Methylopila sp. M107]
MAKVGNIRLWRAGMTVAGLALFAAPAHAGPTLKEEAIVSGDTVTVGDLFDNAEGLEGIALFRAPDPGQTGPLPAAAALAAARRAGVAGPEAGEVRQVFVTRLSREITNSDITGSITARAATEYGVDVDAVEVKLDGAAGPVHVPAAEKGSLEVTRFVTDRQTGRFEASLAVAGAPRRGAEPIRVTGAAVETVEVATLSRSLERGDVVSAADIRADRRPKSQASDAMAPDQVVGLAAKRSIREGQPLRTTDLGRPQQVERNAFVTLIYGASGVSLSLRAKALASGVQGDVIAVQNVQSKRVVNGVVTGPSEVTVTAPTTTVARR